MPLMRMRAGVWRIWHDHGLYENSLGIAFAREFVSLAVMVVLSIFLRQRGSPESKPVHVSPLGDGLVTTIRAGPHFAP